MSYINIKVDSDDLYEMLCDRVRYWRDGEVANLFCKMYERYCDEEYFEGAEFDVRGIVDNDVVNWCSVIELGDPDFDRLLELYHEGEYDVSCEHLDCGASFIEAVNDAEDMILIRQ